MHIKPFAAWRPQKEYTHLVPIYPNGLNSDEARKLAAQKNLYSIAHVVKPRIDFDDKIDKSDARLGAYATEYWRKLVKTKVLVPDTKPAYYIYRLTQNNHVQTGIIALTHTKDYEQNIIKKHENIRTEKIKENLLQTETTQLYSNPVFMAYRPVEAIDKIIKVITQTKPLCSFVSEYEIGQELWQVDDYYTIEEITRLFEDLVPESFIADGHHRCASASEYARLLKEKEKAQDGEPKEDAAYNYFLSCFFPSNQLQILPYNRLVETLNGMTPQDFLQKVYANFQVIPTGKTFVTPSDHAHISMFLNESWYTLISRKEIDKADVISGLGVSILQDELLAPILGIHDAGTDTRLDFVPGTRDEESLVRRVRRGRAAVAFVMYPVQMEELMAVSDAGKIMPPKSTWFEPKLLSGLVTYKF